MHKSSESRYCKVLYSVLTSVKEDILKLWLKNDFFYLFCVFPQCPSTYFYSEIKFKHLYNIREHIYSHY